MQANGKPSTEKTAEVMVALSGGVDSSLITGLLAQEGVPHLNTFTVGFEDVGKEEGNEFRYSDLVAQTFGTEHHQVFIDSGTLLKHLPGCFSAMAEPMVSHDVIGFYLLRTGQRLPVMDAAGQVIGDVYTVGSLAVR